MHPLTSHANTAAAYALVTLTTYFSPHTTAVPFAPFEADERYTLPSAAEPDM